MSIAILLFEQYDVQVEDDLKRLGGSLLRELADLNCTTSIELVKIIGGETK